MEALLASSSTPVWMLVLLGFGSLAMVSVGVWRKYKSGELEDDGTLLDRTGKDNVNLRIQLDLANAKYEDERLKRRRAEDAAAIYYRQLFQEGITPKEVPRDG